MAKRSPLPSTLIADRMAGHPLGSEINKAVPFVHLRLVDRSTGMAWYVAEYDADIRIALVHQGIMALSQWAYISLGELDEHTYETGEYRAEIDECFESCEAFHIAD